MRVGWKNTQIVRNVDDIRTMRQQPIILGRGKALFNDVKERHALRLLEAKPLERGLVRLTYKT